VPVRLLAANIGQNQPLPANGRIELQFDRLLQPFCITRQTFVLEDIGMTTAFTPTVAYDPVARIVTITPLTDSSQALKPQQSYNLVITTPRDANDANGLRAIDGATLEAPAFRTIAFTVVAPLASPPSTVSIDFCRDIHPIFASNCSLSACHLAPASKDIASSAAGLVLDPPSYIASTALGRVSQGANTGPRSLAAAPSLLFGEDMPIVDSSGDPGNSWLMYKLLLAVPTPPKAPQAEAGAAEAGPAPDAGGEAGASADAGAADATAPDGSASDAGSLDADVVDGAAPDGGVAASPPLTVPPVDVSRAHGLPWTADSDADRQVLSNYILGREMPYPGFQPPLTLDELERISLWIAQGAPSPGVCK